MTTAWTIAIDWDRNGNYADTYDDVTNRVMSAKWFLGSRVEYEEIADEAMLDLELDNQDRRYSPEYASSPLFGKVVPQRPVRIQSDDGTTTRTHWVGWVNTIEPAVNQYGKRTVRLTATGAMQYLKAAESNLELQENKRTNEIVAALIKEVVIPPALNRAWILERVGNSELGQTTHLADTSAYSVLDTGILTLGVAADNWVIQGGASDEEKDTFDVYRAIRDIAAAEHGKFLFNREGKALFWNRHHLLQGGTPVDTFDNNMTEMVYTYANIDQTKNEVIVVCHPRKISVDATDVLWELSDAIIRVAPGKTQELYVKYEDEGKNRVGGRDVFVTDVEYDSGTATVTLEAKANGALLKITNNGTEAAIVKKCVVKGRKILDSGEMEAKAINQGSIIDYGRRTLRINLPSIDNLEHAQYIAEFERNRRSQPRGDVVALTLVSHGKNGGDQHAHQLARTLGDLIRVKETQAAHDKNYYIIGEAHELTHGANFWKTTWYLEVAPEQYPWKLEDANSELGGNTRLAY